MFLLGCQESILTCKLFRYVETGSVKYNQTHNNFSHDRLLPVFKSLGVLIQMIVASKRCYDSVNLILFKGITSMETDFRLWKLILRRQYSTIQQSQCSDPYFFGCLFADHAPPVDGSDDSSEYRA